MRTATQWFAVEKSLDGWKDGEVRTCELVTILEENLANKTVIERDMSYHAEDGDTFGRFIAVVAFIMACIALTLAVSGN